MPVLVLLVLLATACTYRKTDLVLGPANCDTTSMSYAADIVPILSAKCYQCHSGTALAGAGIKLDTYALLKVYVNNGRLAGAINHAPGYVPMPEDASKLPACTINQIGAWIAAGALNN